ncbi:MAG: glycosyltransferase [Muribaculaceae bacterium]|nr:glycosyltransferase [Muribaculaceae bacterium]
MYLSPIMTNAALWLLFACFVCVLLLAAIYFFRVRRVVNYRRKADRERADVPDSSLLPASVVIYSQGDAEDLTRMLKAVLAQDYPAAFEVIVVNEGESSDVRDAVSMLRASHSNLYLTFTPEGVVNLSRKKLGITLGIKAARYDIVVLTTTAAEIESPLWLRRMMSRFDREGKTEVVLGFAYIDPAEDSAFGRRRRAFDYVADSIRWLAVAIAGKPFRGTEYNIAYRKDAFMRNKGFARTLNLHYGDDDIFVSEIAKRDNTAVELSDESIVRLRHGNHPRIFSERVLRRFFTESHIRRRPRFLNTLTGWLQIGAFGTGIAAGIIDYPNMQPTIVAAVIIVAMLALDIFVWKKAMKALKSRPLTLTLPWLSVTYPLRKASRHLRSKLGHQKKYTWD